jgi:hypothetical protein
LEAEEEEPAAFYVDVVVGYAGDYLGDRELDRGAVFEDGREEGFVGRFDADFGCRDSGVVVVETEVFVAERR